jgi:pimeloyl-ACP methyl ester carboxylesterase
VQGSEADWVERGGLAAVMDSLVAAGMPEMIVVMPDGDDGFYTSWARPPKWRLCPLRTDLREPATEFCVRRTRYDEYVAQELVRHIDATFRTLADARHRGIAGLSMGGFGALALATQYPHAFSAAASHSGAVAALALAVDTAAGTVTLSSARWYVLPQYTQPTVPGRFSGGPPLPIVSRSMPLAGSPAAVSRRRGWHRGNLAVHAVVRYRNDCRGLAHAVASTTHMPVIAGPPNWIVCLSALTTVYDAEWPWPETTAT